MPVAPPTVQTHQLTGLTGPRLVSRAGVMSGTPVPEAPLSNFGEGSQQPERVPFVSGGVVVVVVGGAL